MNWKNASRTLALVAAVIGALGFAGWVFDIDALKRIHPAWVTMKANTGLCLILAGLAIALLHGENVDAFRRRVAQVCAVLIFAVGLLTLGEHLGWWTTGLDQALFAESQAAAGRSFPGRMNPPSTLNFMLLGLAVLLLDARPRFGLWPAQFCACAVIADILARLTAGETLADYPARLRCKDGSRREVLIHSSVYWEDGKFIHTRCFTRDITERNRADAELAQARDAAEAASRAKDDFLAVLSHELRTPLTPALAAVSELESAPPSDPAELRESLALIRRNVELEARLVDDLLDLTRISAGKLRIASAPVDLHVILRDALAIAEPVLREKNIAVESGLEASRHLVRGDAARLAQVFSNVLTNAAKFTPPAGRVTLRSTNVDGSEVCVEVGDSGIGIAPEMLPVIFEPFRQEEASTTRRFGGLGLGLSVAKSLVEAHGGTISARSDGRDRGATFAITLPALEATALAAENPAASAETLRVLLIRFAAPGAPADRPAARA